MRTQGRLIVAVVMLMSVQASVHADVKASIEEARELGKAGKAKEAIALYQKIAKDTANPLDVRLGALDQAGNLQYRAGEYQQAADTFKTSIDLAGEKADARTWYMYGTSIFRGRSDLEKAIAVLEKNALDRKDPDSHVMLIYAYESSGDRAGYWKQVIALIHGYPHHDGAHFAAQSIIKANAGEFASLPEPESLYRSLLQSLTLRPDGPKQMETIQQAVVALLTGTGNFKMALFEAKVLSETASSSEGLKLATDALSMSLKVNDGNLARVNRYLSFLKTGAAGPDRKLGTEDDAANPLANVESPIREERDKLFLDAIARQPADWNGRLNRAALYRYMSRPKDAGAELRAAFAFCPVEQEPLQKVTDRIVELLVQYSGDPEIGKTFVAYQQYGDAGVDGKDGTADDLKDPLAVCFPNQAP